MYFERGDLLHLCRLCFKNTQDCVKLCEITDVWDAFETPSALREYEDIFSNFVCKSCYKQLINTQIFMNKIQHSRQILDYIVFIEKENKTKEITYCLDKDMNFIIHINEREKSVVHTNDCDFEEKILPTSSDSVETLALDGNIVDDKEIVNGALGKVQENEADVPFIATSHFEKVTKDLVTSDICKDSYKKFLCRFCGKLFKNKNRYLKHLSKFCPAVVHSAKRPQNRTFVCNICGKGFIHIGHFKRHKKCHSQYRCELCFKTFSKYELHDKHMTTMHKSVSSAQCSVCHVWFSTSRRLQNHIISKHSEASVKKAIENKCNANTNLANQLMCAECGKMYNCLVSYKRHQLLHAGIKNFHCLNCTSSFFTKSELIRHRRYKHEKDEARKYVCTECNVSFVEGIRFKAHMRKHRGERSFACSICSKSYFSNRMLKLHLQKKHGASLHKRQI